MGQKGERGLYWSKSGGANARKELTNDCTTAFCTWICPHVHPSFVSSFPRFRKKRSFGRSTQMLFFGFKTQGKKDEYNHRSLWVYLETEKGAVVGCGCGVGTQASDEVSFGPVDRERAKFGYLRTQHPASTAIPWP